MVCHFKLRKVENFFKERAFSRLSGQWQSLFFEGQVMPLKWNHRLCLWGSRAGLQHTNPTPSTNTQKQLDSVLHPEPQTYAQMPLLRKIMTHSSISLSLSFPLLQLVPTFYAAAALLSRGTSRLPQQAGPGHGRREISSPLCPALRAATAPTKGSARHVNTTCTSAYDYTIPPMEKVLVKTDIQIALPSGCYGKSGSSFWLGSKTLHRCRAGVIR